MDQVAKATALKPWRGLRARDLRCSDEVVETRSIETTRTSCVKTSTVWVPNGTLLKKLCGTDGVDPIPELFVRELWSVRTRRGAGNRTHHYQLWKGVQRNNRWRDLSTN